jgi:hypothetical protein
MGVIGRGVPAACAGVLAARVVPVCAALPAAGSGTRSGLRAAELAAAR